MNNKSLLFKMLALVACMTCATASAQSVSVYMPNVSGVPGETVTIPVSIYCDVDMTAFQIRFSTDLGVDFTSAELIDRIDPSATTYIVPGSGIMAYNTNGSSLASLEAGDGVVTKFYLKIPADAEPGTYTMTLHDMMFQPIGTSGSAHSIYLDDVTATLTVSNSMSHDYDFKYNGIYYNITGVNTVEVTNNGNGSYSGSVSIPSTVSYYGKPYQVTAIGNLAFYECFGLKTVSLPSSVTTIGMDAFHNCFALTSVNIPNAVTSIGIRAFYYCQSLTSLSIPNSVRTIGSSAFCGCNNLASISLGNQLNTIGNNAFQDCYSLTSITLPKSVTSIGDTPFLGCNSLAMIKVENGNSVYDSRNNCNAVIQTSSNMLVCGCKTTVIPNTVTSIGDGAFAFIETLSEIVIPNSVTEIGVSAFYYCGGLERVTIGKSVTNIDMQAFCSCWALTDIICLAATPPSLDLTTFDDDTYEQATLTVSAFSLNAYKTADYWKNFTTIEGFLQGDLNGDGEIDVADVTLLIDAVLNSTPVNRGAADLNSDGTIDVADVTALIDRILNGGMDPYDPHNSGVWLVLLDRDGSEMWYTLHLGAEGVYTTVVSLNTSVYGTGRAKFYIVDDGLAYGAPQANQAVVLGNSDSNPLSRGKNFYTVPAGYSYVLGMAFDSNGQRCVYSYQGPACN